MARTVDKRQVAFEIWVPPTARQKISELRALPTLSDDNRRLLDRLATYPMMRTGVWEKLPPAAKGAEDFIIEWAFIGAQFVAAYRPPWPRRKKQLGEYLRKYPPIFAPENVAAYASMLLDAMKATSHRAKEGWSSLWSGDPRVTFEDVVSIVEHIATFNRRLDEKDQEIFASVSLPNIRKRNARNAPEWLFTRLLADHFQRRFGKALDPIVAELYGVVVDQDEVVEGSTIRGRRRSTPGAAHSAKKSK
jgi:hypothetical protein